MNGVCTQAAGPCGFTGSSGVRPHTGAAAQCLPHRATSLLTVRGAFWSCDDLRPNAASWVRAS
jgi:hypothetical protein